MSTPKTDSYIPVLPTATDCLEVPVQRGNMTSYRAHALQETLAHLVAERDALIISFPIIRHDQSPPPFSTPRPSPTSVASGTESRTKTSFSNDDVIILAHRIVKSHITSLGRYNEIRDIGQGLLGMIAEQRGVRTVDVMEEFGVVGMD